MKSDLVYTIIPNWNLKDDLRECLASLLASPDPAHQVVVVDNGSTDGSPEMVRGEFPGVELLAQAQNLGYAGALNAGIRWGLQQGAEYIFGLNNDTLLPPGAVRRLVETARRHPQIGLLTPRVLNYGDPTRLCSLGARIYPWLPLPVEFGVNWPDHPRYHRLLTYDYVIGCAMLIPARVLRQVGLFETVYFMHYEDNDFCQRVRAAGWQIGMDGTTEIRHKVSQSLNRDRSTSIRRRARNGMWFYRRYAHGPARWLTRLALVASTYFKAGRHLLAGKPAYARAQLDGFWEGWSGPLPPPADTRLVLESG